VPSPIYELRLPAELRARAEAAAKTQGVSLAAWVKTQMLAGLHVADGETPTVERPVRGCRHPRDRRRILTYGTWCERCGERVR